MHKSFFLLPLLFPSVILFIYIFILKGKTESSLMDSKALQRRGPAAMEMCVLESRQVHFTVHRFCLYVMNSTRQTSAISSGLGVGVPERSAVKMPPRSAARLQSPPLVSA